MSFGLCLIGATLCSRINRELLQTDDKRLKVWRKEGRHNRPQITEHYPFSSESTIVCAGFPYRTDLCLFKWVSGTAIRYLDEILDLTVGLYGLVPLSFEWMIMHGPIEL